MRPVHRRLRQRHGQIGRPAGLIAYDTDINAQRRLAGKPPLYRLIRARTILYAAIIALVGAVMLYSLATRNNMSVNVLHERNPLYVQLSDGGVRNDYTVRILEQGRSPKLRPGFIRPAGRGAPHRGRRTRRRRQAAGRGRKGSDPRVPPLGATARRGGAAESRRHRDQGNRYRHRTGGCRQGSFRSAQPMTKSDGHLGTSGGAVRASVPPALAALS